MLVSGYTLTRRRLIFKDLDLKILSHIVTSCIWQHQPGYSLCPDPLSLLSLTLWIQGCSQCNFWRGYLFLNDGLASLLRPDIWSSALYSCLWCFASFINCNISFSSGYMTWVFLIYIFGLYLLVVCVCVRTRVVVLAGFVMNEMRSSHRWPCCLLWNLSEIHWFFFVF